MYWYEHSGFIDDMLMILTLFDRIALDNGTRWRILAPLRVANLVIHLKVH